MRLSLIAAAGAVVLASAACSHAPGMPGDGGGGDGPGRGPGMRGGDGPGYGMGPGMMEGPGAGGYEGLQLTEQQRAQMGEIRNELRRKQSALMNAMHAQGPHMHDAYRADGTLDEEAARKAYDAMAAVRRQMFENSLEARRRIDALLTPEQRERLRRP